MIPGIRGTLLSLEALQQEIPDALAGLLDETGRARARLRLRNWYGPLLSTIGPVSAARTIMDRLASPLLAQLGYRTVPTMLERSAFTGGDPLWLSAVLQGNTGSVAALVVTGWGHDPGSVWRKAVLHGIALDARWCFCITGPDLRIFDGRRTYSRQFVEFDLATCIDDERAFAVFWGLLRADAMSAGAEGGSLLDRAVEISEAYRASVRSSLQAGVHEALEHLNRALSTAARSRSRKSGATAPSVFQESLIVIYRILFLLFAEARGLVPAWHPVYREGYTIESLRMPVELLPRPRGLWETLQSIARLAHRGCRIGALRVTPFNGRLFSPIESPLADRVALDDGEVRTALLALTTRASAGGRQRISYGDLGVEQLGGVYERVLDLEPVATATPARGLQRTERRKSTGSFYTPRSLTEYLVRRALAPLVADAAPERILELRVLDPAMGSGAFLVAACRYLASAYEAALCREGGFGPDDIDEHERAHFRRSIAQRCLYGVDINPMAVQLGRLSLWLATLAADRPLTFLDHRLRVGNSLVGAALHDLSRSPGPRGHRSRLAALPLFDDPGVTPAIEVTIKTRESIAVEPGDTLPQVRAKEQALARLAGADGPLSAYRSACDLWCSTWFGAAKPHTRPPFTSLLDSLLGRPALPRHISAPFLETALAVAASERFFHWTLEFPEVFQDFPVGRGFDAVIGNPPWEMLRGDRGDTSTRDAARSAASNLTEFCRASGVYALQGTGHGNLYQLFLERMLSLVRSGGRLGVIVPYGLATDHGAVHLRRRLLDRTNVDTFVSFENRDAVFPIHRSVRFLLLSATVGSDSASLPCRFGVRRPEDLDRLPDVGADPAAVRLPRALVERASGTSLTIPDVRCSADVELLGHCTTMFPALGDAEGWNVRFGRELNATDDKPSFARARGPTTLPVLEGKLIAPFSVDTKSATQHIRQDDAAALLDPEQTFRRARLAYREVAASTNRLTLIAAIVPAGTVTTHTLFCVKQSADGLPDGDSQLFLCGMFNSYVANYLIRLRVTTHVTAAAIDRLPMPYPSAHSGLRQQITSLAAALCASPDDPAAQATLQACAARAYGITRRQFAHILSTFPLVPMVDRDAALASFCDIV